MRTLKCFVVLSVAVSSDISLMACKPRLVSVNCKVGRPVIFIIFSQTIFATKSLLLVIFINHSAIFDFIYLLVYQSVELLMLVHFQNLDGVIQLKMRTEKAAAAGETSRDDSCMSEQSEKERWKTLSLHQLNDLQSKLMLVAGKASEGKEQVDRYVEVVCTPVSLFSCVVHLQ